MKKKSKLPLIIIGSIIGGCILIFCGMLFIGWLATEVDKELGTETTNSNGLTKYGQLIYEIVAENQSSYVNPKSVMITSANICSVTGASTNKTYDFAYIKTSAQNKMGGYTTNEFYINLENKKYSKTDIKYDHLFNYDYCMVAPEVYVDITQDEIKIINNMLSNNY